MSDDNRPVLLGMNNPISSAPEHALFPYPPGCTGHRILELLRRRRPEVTRRQYLDAFDRRNLLSTIYWSASKARAAAELFLREMHGSGRVVLVLGEGPRIALGLEKKLIEPIIRDCVTWRQLPHPSGRNLWYNDRTCSDLAAGVLEELYVQSTGGRT